MGKMRDQLVERRRYLRLLTPISITYTVTENGRTYNTVTKNISADGMRFETMDRDMQPNSRITVILVIPTVNAQVHAKGVAIWKKKISLEDGAPYDVGVEFTEVEEADKNTFLKFLCDLLYDLSKEL